ncbi:MAG: ATP-dependent DNA ligase [Verrucomicrobia bacterium]|nr:ATP-dependent DNA ligase [Verrucomicrobiota bacterium]MDA1203619.1 ATP-dependent DNA ligase [Verrucomicrobiota bacterium]
MAGPKDTLAPGEDPGVIEVAYRGGVLVPAIDLWMDPRVPQGLAFVSHAHSDHAGKHRETILSAGTSRLMRSRIGASRQEHVLEFGEPRELRGAQFTLLPAGHVHGSAQLHLETEGGSLLYTGDFKLRAGLSSEPIAWRGAETLIMETTFGKPEFVFPPTEQVLAEMVKFCREALEDGEVPVLLGYSLGKAQEILCAVAAAGLKPMLHGAVAKLTEIYRQFVPGVPDFAEYEASGTGGHVLICPPSVRGSRMIQRIKKRRVAMLTGWAMTPGAAHRYQVDAVFPLSDHAGYDDLLRYVELVRPDRVLTLHGYASEFARDLRERGMEAWSLVSPDQLEFPGFVARPAPRIDTEAEEGVPDSDFGKFCAVGQAVAGATGRLAKTSLLAAYLRSLDDADLPRAATWFTGQPFAATDGRSAQSGWAVLRRALGAASGRGEDEVRAISRRCNDAGLAAREIMVGRPGSVAFSLAAVQALFDGLAGTRGPVGRQALLGEFFASCQALEASYVVRILTGDLRIGLKEGLLEEAIASAFGAEPEGVREAGMLLGDMGVLAVAAKRGELEAAGLRVFHPVKCMLAGSEPDGAALWGRLSGTRASVWVENKYDGIRAQVHVADGRCEIFSRDLRSVTAQFPEIAAAAAKLPGPVVLDGEILASMAGRRLTFFDLQKRLNRRDADLFMTEDIPVEFVAFDVLWRDGTTLLRQPWHERRAVLEQLPLGGPLSVARATRVESAGAVEEEFRAARARGNEGLVGKDPQSPYTPGRRGLAWVKLKKEFATLDVVVTGVEYGHGRRREVLSDYTFAVRDEASGSLLTIGKAYSGLTDEEIAGLTPWFLDRVQRVKGRLHEVKPELVIEVAFDSIQPSTRHPSGLALRFPRIKALRKDKRLAEIDSLQAARKLAGI